MTNPVPEGFTLPYDFSLVSDLHGNYVFDLSLTWEHLHLTEMEGRLGQLDLFSDPTAQFDFNTAVSPLQAGVLINFAHWTLPRMGPVIVSTAARAAENYVVGQGWQLSPNLKGNINLALMRWVSVNVGFQLNITPDHSWAHFSVEPAASVALTFSCLFDNGEVCRPRH